jgi:hypothetical protein
MIDLEPRPAWHRQAACKGATDLFFPNIWINNRAMLKAIREAKVVCLRCPVIKECGEWAIANHEDHGVWGGMSERQRKEIRAERKATA